MTSADAVCCVVADGMATCTGHGEQDHDHGQCWLDHEQAQLWHADQSTAWPTFLFTPKPVELLEGAVARGLRLISADMAAVHVGTPTTAGPITIKTIPLEGELTFRQRHRS